MTNINYIKKKYGNTVVDSNLAPYKITLHMIMALIIVAMILYVIFKSKTIFKTQQYNSTFHKLLIFENNEFKNNLLVALTEAPNINLKDWYTNTYKYKDIKRVWGMGMCLLIAEGLGPGTWCIGMDIA